MTADELLKLVTEMLSYLDGQWSVKPDSEYAYPRVTLRSTNDTHWSILLRYYDHDKRLVASASLGYLDSHLNNRVSDERMPSIKMSPARTARDLGRDINKRVVAHLSRLAAIAGPRWIKETQKKHDLQDRCQRLSVASGRRLGETRDSDRDQSVYRREMSCPLAKYQTI